jgi:hypothetical protein
VTNLPDDQFEAHLKQFHPLAPEPMQFDQRKPNVWPPRKMAVWAAVAAVLIVALLLAFRFSRQPGSDHVTAERIVAPSPESLVPQPLTIVRAAPCSLMRHRSKPRSMNSRLRPAQFRCPRAKKARSRCSARRT